MEYRTNDMEYRTNDMEYRTNDMEYRKNDVMTVNDGSDGDNDRNVDVDSDDGGYRVED